MEGKRVKGIRLRTLFIWLTAALLIETGVLAVFSAGNRFARGKTRLAASDDTAKRPSSLPAGANSVFCLDNASSSAGGANGVGNPVGSPVVHGVPDLSADLTIWNIPARWTQVSADVEKRSWRYIIIHHSATAAGSAEAFEAYHRARGMSNGLAYHFVLDNGSHDKPDGEVEIGSRWPHQLPGGHCRQDTVNHQAIGICLVGDFSKNRPTDKQIEALAWLVHQLQKQFNIPAENVLGHGQVLGEFTECPGQHFGWERFRATLARIDEAERAAKHAAFSTPLRLPPLSLRWWSGQFLDGQ